MKIILASSSPRRRELLQLIGIVPQVIAPQLEEHRRPGESVESFVERITLAKGLNVYRRQHFQSLLISADTVVVVGGRMIGKPRDARDAAAMLRQLSGRTHEVLTGVALMHRGQSHYELARTRVTFKKLTDAEINFYLERADYQDKAGAYAVQGLAAIFVSGVEGCYFNVMGFPLGRFYTMLEKLGIPLSACVRMPRGAGGMNRRSDG